MSAAEERRKEVIAAFKSPAFKKVASNAPALRQQAESVDAEFKRQTGCGVIVNTSFNIRGEPIVCTPQDAYRCFMRTNMDYLVVGSCILDKNKQPKMELPKIPAGAELD